MSLVQQMLQMLKTQESYKGVKPYLERIQRNDHSIFEPVCETIKEAFKINDPVQVLFAARLGKDSVDTKNQEFIDIFQGKCLPLYEKIGEFRKEDQNDDRGKYFFSDNPDKNQSSYGNSFLRLILESIQTWARQFPQKHDIPTPFYQSYARLKIKLVKFPPFKYFKQEEVIKTTSPQFVEPTTSSIIMPQQKQPVQAPPKPSQKLTPQPPPQPSQSVQQMQQSFDEIKEMLKQQAIQKQPTVNHFVKSLKQIIEDFVNLNLQIDKQVNILLEQEDEANSMELIGLQEDIKEILKNYEKLQQGDLTPNEYAAILDPNVAISQKKAPQYNLSQIKEETEVSSSSVKGKIDNKLTQLLPVQQVDSVGLQYNMDHVLQEFEKQLENLRKQHNEELNLQLSKQQQEFSTQLQTKDKQLTDLTQQKNQLQNENQEMKKREQRFKDIENSYIQLQNAQSGQSYEYEELRKNNRILTQQAQRLEQLVQGHEKELNTLQTENSNLQNQITQLKTLNQQLVSENNQLKQPINIGPQTDLGRQVQVLQNKLQDEKQINKDRQTQLINEKKSLEEQLRNQKLENSNLNEKILDLNIKLEQYKKNSEIQNQLNLELKKRVEESLQNNLQGMEDQAMKQKFNQLVQQFQQQEKQKQAQIEKYTQEITELNRQLFEKDKQLNKQSTPIKIQDQRQIEVPQIPIDNYIQNVSTPPTRIPVDRGISRFYQTGPAGFQKQKIGKSEKTEKSEQFPYCGYESFPRMTKFNSYYNGEKRQLKPTLSVTETILFPYSSPQQYYRSKEKKQQGIKVQFINTLQDLNLTEKNLLAYKQNHLFRSNIMFTDSPDVSVAVDSQMKKLGGEIYINYGIYLKTDLPNLKIKSYVKNAINLDSLWVSQQEVNQTLIKNEQYLLEASLRFYPRYADETLILELNYNNKISQVYLQKQILSLVNYHKIEVKMYKRKWKMMKKWRSQEFEYNQEIIQDYLDIPKISPHFILVNPDKMNEYLSGIDEIKYAAVISIVYFKIEGILRIEMSPENKMILFFGIEERKVTSEHEPIIIRVLNNLQSILQL